VANPDDAGGENVQEEAAEDLLGRQGHRPHAVPPGRVFPSACRELSRTAETTQPCVRTAKTRPKALRAPEA
jgi:hypothetical protein